MMYWTYERMQRAMGGRWLVRPNGRTLPDHPAVSTDSRTLERGGIYFARRGLEQDGHRFVADAVKAGASLCVVDREQNVSIDSLADVPTLLVEDSTIALGQLARDYRSTLRGKVIALTGSVGKTTTKTILDAVLSHALTGHCNPKSFNNHVGVPLTLLGAEPTDDYVICEVGTNAPGEIAALGKIVEPDVALITNIGRAHLERLGGLDGVLREKASLLSHVREAGLAIVNGDCAGMEAYRRVCPNMLTFGYGEGCDLRITSFASHGQGIEFTVNDRRTYHVPLLGEHNAGNALAAIAVARHLKMSDEQIEAGLQRASAAEMRLHVQVFGSPDSPVVLLNDCYNANPESVSAALRVLSQYPTAGRRVAILGDMAELGPSGPDFHREIGEKVASEGIDRAILIGRLSLFTAEALSRLWPPERMEVLAEMDDSVPEQVVGWIEPGDTVLLKASRSQRFERIAAAIARHWQPAATKGGAGR